MPAPKRARRPKSDASPRDRAIDAAATLAADRGWVRTRLTDIAASAHLTLAELQAEFPAKAALVRAFVQRVDAQMLAGLPESDVGDSARDRLFGVIMRRLDVLRPHRRAVLAFAAAALADPSTACALGAAQRRSLAWMLEAAGLSAAGVSGAVRRAGLHAILVSTLWVWSRDPSPDLERTMAHLDGQLRRVEDLYAFLEPFRRPRYGAAQAKPKPAKRES